jgi:DNA-binding transcriptional MerR regulator
LFSLKNAIYLLLAKSFNLNIPDIKAICSDNAQADTLEQIKQESLRQLSQSEERKIEALSQFIKKIVELS